MMQRVGDNIGIVSAIKENIAADNAIGLTIIYSLFHICSYPIFTNLYENTKIQKYKNKSALSWQFRKMMLQTMGVDHNFSLSFFHICLNPILLIFRSGPSNKEM